MNVKIAQSMYNLFDLLPGYANAFNKRTYENMFLEEYAKHKELFDAIVEEVEASEDAEACIEELAKVLPKRLHAELKKLPNKRKQEQAIMTYNMGMVCFIIPMLYYGRREELDMLTERMIVHWNEHGLEMKISGTTYENIKDGFKPRLCYITTAVCDSLGKADNCYELNLLREYRDNYLIHTEAGEEIVQKYYDIAPTIVKRISREEKADEIYQNIWDEYLKPCVSFIEDGKCEECREKYTEMVHSLQKKYLYS